MDQSSVSTYSEACPKHTRDLPFDIVVVMHQAQHHTRSWSTLSPYTPTYGPYTPTYVPTYGT